MEKLERDSQHMRDDVAIKLERLTDMMTERTTSTNTVTTLATTNASNSVPADKESRDDDHMVALPSSSTDTALPSANTLSPPSRSKKAPTSTSSNIMSVTMIAPTTPISGSSTSLELLREIKKSLTEGNTAAAAAATTGATSSSKQQQRVPLATLASSSNSGTAVDVLDKIRARMLKNERRGHQERETIRQRVERIEELVNKLSRDDMEQLRDIKMLLKLLVPATARNNNPVSSTGTATPKSRASLKGNSTLTTTTTTTALDKSSSTSSSSSNSGVGSSSIQLDDDNERKIYVRLDDISTRVDKMRTEQISEKKLIRSKLAKIDVIHSTSTPLPRQSFHSLL
jgi:hypothetical protein